MADTNNIAYTVGRAAATIERFSKELFGPGTLRKLLSQPKYHIGVFCRDVPLCYWREFTNIAFPDTLTEVQQGTAWIGYYHARADFDLRDEVKAVIKQHNKAADDRWDVRLRIGSQLRALREAKGLSTREFAEKANLVHSHIVRIESGKYGFTIDTLQRICDVLNVTIKLESNG